MLDKHEGMKNARFVGAKQALILGISRAISWTAAIGVAAVRDKARNFSETCRVNGESRIGARMSQDTPATVVEIRENAVYSQQAVLSMFGISSKTVANWHEMGLRKVASRTQLTWYTGRELLRFLDSITE